MTVKATLDKAGKIRFRVPRWAGGQCFVTADAGAAGKMPALPGEGRVGRAVPASRLPAIGNGNWNWQHLHIGNTIPTLRLAHLCAAEP